MTTGNCDDEIHGPATLPAVREIMTSRVAAFCRKMTFVTSGRDKR